VNLSKIRKFDKAFKKKKYHACLSLICNYVNLFLLEKDVFFTLRGIKLFYKEKEICSIDINLFDLSSLDAFSASFTHWASEVFRSFVNECLFSCSISGDSLIDVNRRIDLQAQSDSAVFSSRATRLMNHLNQNKDNPIILLGDSSSGKTVSAIQAISNYIQSNDVSYSWIDFSDVNTDVEHVFYTVLRETKVKNHLLILDNVQAYPSKLNWINSIIQFYNSNLADVNIRLLIISWRSAKRIIKDLYDGFNPIYVNCTGDEIIIELIRKNNLERYEKEIFTNSAGDVFVADSTIKYILKNNSFPSAIQLSDMIYELATSNNTLSEQGNKVLFLVSALGEFEIHVRMKYLNEISESGLKELNRLKILRIYKVENQDSYVTIGHRSLAHKIITYFWAHHSSAYSNPVDLAIEYLSGEKDDQILSTLERLDLELEFDDSIFSKLWQAFCHMRSAIVTQVKIDSTWGNNMASMIFATEAIIDMPYETEKKEMVQICKSGVRKRWAVIDNQLRFIGHDSNIEPTTEIVDFTENIKETMEVDEEKEIYKQDMLSANIDYSRFHDNWLLGLLLGFEADFQEDNYVSQYIAYAGSIQLTSGAFYPERVCWVTARVLMGLSKCGLSYSDDIVKRAANWLVLQLQDSHIVGWKNVDLTCPGWKSGTGTWNSNEQITMMCVCALYSVDYPVRRNKDVSFIVSDFWTHRRSLAKQFIDSGNILDIIWIIDMMLYDKRNPIELKEEISELSDYLSDNWGTASKLSTEKETESSDVSFMAKELISIVWSLLRQNIKELLNGLKLDYIEKEKKKKVFISYRRVEGGGSALAQSVYNGLNEIYRDDVFLDVYDLESVSTEYDPVLYQAVLDSEVVIVIVSDHCFDRAFDSDYDNDKDLFYREIKTAFDNNKKIITVYDSSNRNKCPDELKANPDFYLIAKKLSKRNAAYYDSKKRDALRTLIEDIDKKINSEGI